MTTSDLTRGTDGSTVVQVFGGMGFTGADGPVSIGGPQQRRLLALLALRAGSVASIDWLGEHLWSDSDRPDDPAKPLRTYVSRLRQALPKDAQGWITTESAGYRLDAPETALEHRRFAHLRAQATNARARGDPLAALGFLDDALMLWRGDPFQELEIDQSDVARPVVEQLRLDRWEVLEERWECSLALGRHTQITGELAVFTTEHRLRDRATRQYALALHRSGRTPEALRVVADHRQFLANESGLDPSTEIIALEQAMLVGDTTLDVEKVGRPLRGYRLIDEIGSGAFSIVWRAMQPSVGREVAIKQIRAELASQPEFIRRFEAEAQLIARVEHPHIVPLIDFWRDPDSAYLVMRLLRGDTLERRLDDGPLNLDAALLLARQVGGALSAAHQRGVIHRDVKTGNIMFDESGNAFLGDFGIALEAAESAGPAAAFSTGSPAYSAPEQIRREPLGPEADVFSLGVVLFECLTGTLPFANSGSIPELVDHQLHSDYPPVTDDRPEVPSHISDAIAKATAKDPADRFASATDFVAALNVAPADDGQPAHAPVALATDLPNPYLGLRAFDEADRGNFFGRESLVNTLVGRLRSTGLKSRCVGVVGPSGAGKSSVVRAGLSPAVRRGAIEGSDQWLSTTMVPAGNPFESLEAALLRIAVTPSPSLLDQLQDGRRGVLRSLRTCLADDTHKVYLVIDQFDEIFTAGQDQIAFDFLDALAVAVEDPQSPLRLIFTLRADYYDRPLSHPTFARILDTATVNVTPLSADELERAMVEPAHQIGVGFEPGLVALILADCIGQPAPLPLLQYALSELFERRDGAQLTIAEYDKMGRLTGALATRAETIHDQADGQQQAAIRRSFGRMTSPSGEAADLRRRVHLADLGDDPAIAWVLKQFGDARLLTFDRDPTTREPTVEVAHEALLREWPRLVGWLDEDRDLLRSSDAVATAAANWDASGRANTDLYRGARLETALDLTVAAPDRLRPLDANFIEASQQFAEAEQRTEQKRIQRLRRMVVGIGIALVLALGASAIAFNQQQRANDQADVARAQAQVADEQAALAQQSASDAQAQTQQAEIATLISRSAASSRDNAKVSLLLALEAHRRQPGPDTEQSILNALGTSNATGLVASVPFAFAPGETCPITLTRSLEYGMSNGRLATRNPVSGEIIEYGLAPEPCVFWAGDPDIGRLAIFHPDSNRVWFGPYDGPLDVEIEFDGFFDLSLPRASHRILLLKMQRDQFSFSILDDRTGEQIGEPLLVGEADQLISVPGASLAARLGAYSFFSRQPNLEGRIIVIDVETGEITLDVTVDQPLVHLIIDEVAGELVGISDVDRRLVTMDLATGEVLSSVEISDGDITAITIRPDGLVLAVSRTHTELIDRSVGPIGAPTPLQGVLDVRIREDGLLQAWVGDRIEILDLNLNGLIERTHAIDKPSAVAIQEGLATVVPVDGSGAEIINLSTSERQSLGPITAEGLPAHSIAPVDALNVDAGIWAASLQGLSRWRDGQIVESLPWEELSVGGNSRWYFDQYAHVRELTDGTFVAELFALVPGDLTRVMSLPVVDAVIAHPTADGGLFVVHDNGRLSIYSNDAVLVGEIETEVLEPDAIALDMVSNQLAIGGRGVSVIDLTSGDAVTLPQASPVRNLGFAQTGALLATSGAGGTIRLWDVDRGVVAGVAWIGSGQVFSDAPQNDPTADTMWIASSDRLIEIPLNPQRWVEQACDLAGREFTPAEWDLLVPGDEPLQSACE